MKNSRKAKWIGASIFAAASAILVIWGRETVSWRPVKIEQGSQNADFLLSPDGRYLAASNSDETSRIVDLRSGKIVWQNKVKLKKDETISIFLAFAADSKKLAVTSEIRWSDVKNDNMGTRDTKIEVLDLPSLKRVSQTRIDNAGIMEGDVKFTPQLDAALLLDFDGNDLWDVKNGRRWGVGLKGFDRIANSWNFSPDGAQILVESEVLELYRLRDGKKLKKFPPTPSAKDYERAGFPAMSRDGSLVADSTFGDGNDFPGDSATTKRTRFMNAQSGRVLWRATTSVWAFAPDSKRVVLAKNGRIEVRGARDGHFLRVLTAPPASAFRALCWTPDGNFVLATDKSGGCWRLRAR